MQRRALKSQVHALISTELERRGFLAAFTERTGGVSNGRYASLNLGLETGDGEALVERNRALVSEALGVEDVAAVRQVHGTRLVEVEDVSGSVPDADGLTTSARRVPLAVMVADCVPLALASDLDGAVCAAHVGWRGLASGMVPNAVKNFSDPTRIVAAIGPSIGPCHYEVGPEVVEAVAEGTGGDAVVLEAGPRPRLDLGRTVEASLRRLGVPRVERAHECTACEPARFFSHRRDGTTGRQALVAMRL